MLDQKRSTGVANVDFGPKFTPQASQTVTFSCFTASWTKKRSTGVANADFGPKRAPQAAQTVTFSVFLPHVEPNTARQVSQIMILDQNPLYRRRKWWFVRAFS